MAGSLQILSSVCVSYSTAREARVNSFKTALMFRSLQLSIICYVVGWDIIKNKGYQAFDSVSSALTTKVKGLAFVENKTALQNIRSVHGLKSVIVSSSEFKLYDVGDYVIPPIELNSDLRMSEKMCRVDEDCSTKRLSLNYWNGLPTGKCITSSLNSSIKVCEVISWCPIEGVYHYQAKTTSLIRNVENLTVFIKNNVQFKFFNKRQRNLPDGITNDYIASCIYDPEKNPYCPVFRIGDMVRLAEPDPKERRQLYAKGAVIQIEINWDCNYDIYWIPCMPVYAFNRFDMKFDETETSSGFNFRLSDKFERDGVSYRMLKKAFGLRFMIQVNGKAGKFNFIPFLKVIGSGIGLLSIATMVADCFLLNFTRRRKLYKSLKAPDGGAPPPSSSSSDSKDSENVDEAEEQSECYRI